MALSISIKHRDKTRKQKFHPFSFQAVLIRCWWPLAERLGLRTLELLEVLWITDVEQAHQFCEELELVREALQEPQLVGISLGDASYMLTRIGEVIPLIQEAMNEWDAVEYISV